ncbi:MAG: hypothetical protein ACI9K3_000581, partial [Halovenus sp.]
TDWRETPEPTGERHANRLERDTRTDWRETRELTGERHAN